MQIHFLNANQRRRQSTNTESFLSVRKVKYITKLIRIRLQYWLYRLASALVYSLINPREEVRFVDDDHIYSWAHLKKTKTILRTTLFTL